MTTMPERRAVVLVGHGAVAKGCPRELVTQLKALEAQRRAVPSRHAAVVLRYAWPFDLQQVAAMLAHHRASR